MSEQPEALRLADLWEKHSHGYARSPEARTAAELRRLSAVEAENAELKRRVETRAQALRQWLDKTEWIQETGHGSELGMHRADAIRQRLEKTEAQRDALLEALRPFAAINASIGFTSKDVDRARAAIAKAEGEKA